MEVNTKVRIINGKYPYFGSGEEVTIIAIYLNINKIQIRNKNGVKFLTDMDNVEKI